MAKQQINIKLPPLLIEALRERASTEQITLTDLIQSFCEQGLGLPRSNDSVPDLEQVYDRILSEIDNRIATEIGNRISSQLAPFQEQIEQRIEKQVDAALEGRLAELRSQLETTEEVKADSFYPINVEGYENRASLAKICKVHPGTIGRWEKEGKLRSEGWETVPGTENSSKPVLYRRIAD